MRHIYEDLAYGPVPDNGNFWRSTVAHAPDAPPVSGAMSCDVAVIGGGFTGLNAALALAQAGRDVIVADAQAPGWGASGRNGGFCCLGGAKASPATLKARYGEADAKAYFRAEANAVAHVEALLDTHGIEADTHSQGETLVAHRPSARAALEEHAREISAIHGVACQVIGPDAMAEHGMKNAAFHGAVTNPIGFALNPLKYHHGLARAAVAAGARLCAQSPVTSLGRAPDGRHLLGTPGGQITAKTLVVATNGYSSDTVPRWLAGRYLPAQSNIIVTRPLSDGELADQGWTTRQMCFDTRHLLHYFRLMPDNRMLFGMRGSWRTTRSSLDRAARAARRDFDRTFPAWRHVDTDHGWSGLVCLSRNLTPFAGPVPGLENAYAALAYHGNGVSMGSYAGRLIADQILGTGRDTPALMRRPMRRFELGPLRRLSLPLAYAWYTVKDGF